MPTAQIRPDILYAWKGPSLLIVGTQGECGDEQPLSGYYFREARFLRTLRFAINGSPPWRCEASSLAPPELAFAYTYPEIAEYGGQGSGQPGDSPPTDRSGIVQRALAIRARYVTECDGLRITVTLANHSKQTVECECAWSIDADFADIQEADSGKREQHAVVESESAGGVVVFFYRHERLHYRSQVTATPACEWVASDSRLVTRITLEPHAATDLTLRVQPGTADSEPVADGARRRDAALADWRGGFAGMSMPGNRAIEQVIAANIDDYASFPLLEGQSDEWLALQAGMPLYPALFGRDTLTAGWQSAWLDRGASLEASLTRLGRLQSDRRDDWHDEEPGRIPYQVRQGPLALLDINPYSGYYADYASPLLFVIALAHLYAWTGDRALVRRHWDAARRILEWARTDGDKNRDGYLEYETQSKKGTKNQGWKDSGDAIVYEDGSPVPSPVGTCELQGYWFAAQQLMAIMAFAIGERAAARAYWRSAMALKKRFNRDWWIDDHSCIALALDAKKRPVPAVSSNIGHCIAAGIVSDAHLPAAVARLFAPDMFSGWGVRTLSTAHVAYNPLSYHCGTVWPVEQATIAFGLRRFGFDAEAQRLCAALVDLAALYPGYRVPECVGGEARADQPTPSAYPRANAPQLWNATAFALVVHTLLGLQPVAPASLLVVSPALPEWLSEIVLSDLRLAGGKATIRFWRSDDGRSHASVLESEGTFRLVQQPPPESLSAGIVDRLRALVATIRE